MPKLIDPTLLITALSIQQNASANPGVRAMLDEVISRINDGRFDAKTGATVSLRTRRGVTPPIYACFARVPMPGEHVQHRGRTYQVEAVVMQPIADDPDRVADVYLLGFEAAARVGQKL